VGPPGWNWLVASPDVWRLIPSRYHRAIEDKVNYPRGASWLPARLTGVLMRTGLHVTRATVNGDCAAISLSDGTTRLVDHVLLGTGYRVDVAGYDFLGPDLLRGVRRRRGYPILRGGMESSTPGLHFLGAPAAFSFGPVMRFVCGSAYGARALTSRVLGRRPKLIDFAW